MSKDELVRAYMDGKISRRLFVKRLVISGVSLGAAISYASLLAAGRAGAKDQGGRGRRRVPDYGDYGGPPGPPGQVPPGVPPGPPAGVPPHVPPGPPAGVPPGVPPGPPPTLPNDTAGRGGPPQRR